MTTKHYLLGGILLLAFATLSSCKKEFSDLPAATQTGENTFGCKVNGENWGPAKFGVVPATNLVEAFLSSPESVRIRVRNFSAEPTETVMEIQVSGLNDHINVYPINQTFSTFPTAVSYGYMIKTRINTLDEWQSSASNTGSITVTKFDRTNKILSGTFEFSAASTMGGQTINVTDGRFDVKYQ